MNNHSHENNSWTAYPNELQITSPELVTNSNLNLIPKPRPETHRRIIGIMYHPISLNLFLPKKHKNNPSKPSFLCCRLLFILFLTAAYPIKAATYEDSCVAAFRTNNFNLAKALCEKELIKAHANNNQKSVLKIYIALIDIFKHLDDFESFEQYLLIAKNHPLFDLELTSKYDWLRLKAMRLHHTKKLNQSNQLFQQALKIALELNDERKISDSNIDLGVSATRSGDFKTAMNHYRTSLEITRERNDPYAIGLSLKSVGDAYLNLEEYPSAISFFDEALMNYEQYTETKGFDNRVHERISVVYEKLMETHQKMNHIDEVQRYKNKIKQSQTQLSSGHDQANEWVQQAKLLLETEQYSMSVEKLTEALGLYQAEGIENPSEVYYLLALSYKGLKQHDIAIDYASQGIELPHEKETSGHVRSQILQLLSQLYTDHDPVQALHFANQYNQAREHFLNTKYNSDLKTIQHHIELEKKQNKIVTSQIEIIQQKVKIQTLNNRYLLSVLLLFCLLALIVYLYVKKKQQQAELQATIRYHRNQLAVLSLTGQHKESISCKQSLNQINQTTINQMLVQVLHDATNIWTELTGENLIELADRSKIWTITNDNGTLRTRSLDKYLSLQKIPKNPRWRNVVRTCHFVLAETDLAAQKRHELNAKLESLIQSIKDFYGTDDSNKLQ